MKVPRLKLPHVAWSPARAGLVSIALGLVLTIGFPAWHLVRAAQHLSALQARVGSAQPGSLPLDRLPEIRPDLTSAAVELRAARGGLAPFDPIWRLVGRVPPLRAIGAVPDLLDLGESLTGAGADLVEGLGTLKLDQPGKTSEILDGLAAHQDRFQRATLEVAAAEQARARIDRSAFSGRLSPIGRRLDELDRWLPEIEAGAAALAILPSALGVDRPTTYLLAGQNEEERRATGGFIGSLGVVTVDHGRVTHIDVRNSYDFSPPNRDPLPPPAPLATLMGFGGWYIRDANWFPDFPTSAAWLEWFWDYYYGEQPDGVIAFDQEAFRQLLEITGPVYLPEIRETIGAQNYRERTLYWLYEAGSTTGERRFVRGAKTTFAGELGTAVFKRLVEMPPSDFLRQGAVLQRLLLEKHVQISLRDPSAAQLLAQEGWDGHVDRAAPDYLLASDATVTYTKVAPFVGESIDVAVTLGADGTTRHDVSIGYANNYDQTVARGSYPLEYLGAFWNRETRKLDYQEGIYATYLRVYVPAEAQMLEVDGADGFVSVDRQHDRRVFAAYVELPAGARKTVRFSYLGPRMSSSFDTPYQLLVQKPAGTDAIPLVIRVVAPDGYVVPGQIDRPNVATLATDLREDRRYTVRFVPAGSSRD